MAIDDRGNVVDIYNGGEHTATIDREADPVAGLKDEFGYAWNGDAEGMQIAIGEGYQDDLAIAIICELLRGDAEAGIHAINFINLLIQD